MAVASPASARSARISSCSSSSEPLVDRPGPRFVGRPAGPSSRRAALTRLTELFEVARFSDTPVSDAMRGDALAAVEALLAGGAGVQGGAHGGAQGGERRGERGGR